MWWQSTTKAASLTDIAFTARPPIHPYDSPRLVSLTRIYNERFPSAPSSPILVQHVENDFGPPPVVTSPAPVHTQYQLPARLTVPLPYVPYHRQSWAVAPPSKLSIAKSKIRFTVINVHRAVVDKFYLVWNKIKGRSAERRRRSDTGRSMGMSFSIPFPSLSYLPSLLPKSASQHSKLTANSRTRAAHHAPSRLAPPRLGRRHRHLYPVAYRCQRHRQQAPLLRW